MGERALAIAQSIVLHFAGAILQALPLHGPYPMAFR